MDDLKRGIGWVVMWVLVIVMCLIISVGPNLIR